MVSLYSNKIRLRAKRDAKPSSHAETKVLDLTYTLINCIDVTE